MTTDPILSRETAEMLRALNAHHKEWHPACARRDDIERAARAALATPNPRADALLRVVEAARTFVDGGGYSLMGGAAGRGLRLHNAVDTLAALEARSTDREEGP